jgi:RNA polymerase sigma factor (TIGR02999 family)
VAEEVVVPTNDRPALQRRGIPSVKDVQAVRQPVASRVAPPGNTICGVVNCAHRALAPEVLDARAEMVREPVDRHYLCALRWSSSGFLRDRLDPALAARGLAPHIYETDADARRALRGGRGGRDPRRPRHALPRDNGRMSAPPLDELFDTLYADLRRLAHAKLRQLGDAGGLNTTALVHESYVRLAQRSWPGLESRGAFMAYAARVMRSVVVDLARESAAQRRGGGERALTLDTALRDQLPAAGDAQLLALNEALQALEAVDERLARLVEMRFFAGMTMDEVAQALDTSKRSAERDWDKARRFLLAQLHA